MLGFCQSTRFAAGRPNMKPEKRFLNQPKHFWANVRTISQQAGYTVRNKRQIKIPDDDAMRQALGRVDLSDSHIWDEARNVSMTLRQLPDEFSVARWSWERARSVFGVRVPLLCLAG